MKNFIVFCVFLFLTVGQAKVWDLSKYRPRSILYTLPDDCKVRVECNGPVNTWGTEIVKMKPKSVTTIGKNRIVGGTEVVPNSLPWQVAFFVDDEYFCGGSLISDQWILTAAHCVDNGAVFDILLGAHNIHQDEPDRVELRTTEYYMHPQWGSNRLRNDIALIKLPEPVTFSDNISPIGLASTDEPDHVGDELHVSGWGKTSADGDISSVLREIELIGIDNQECTDTYGLLTIKPTNLCTSTNNGKSTCNNDSGGPLSYIDNDGVFRQVGIVSFGSPRGCEVGEPVVFSRVSSFISWISSVTGLAI